MSLAAYFPSVQGLRACGTVQGNASAPPNCTDAAAPGGMCIVGGDNAGTVLVGPASRNNVPNALPYWPGKNNQGAAAPAGETAPNALCQKVAGFSATHVFNGLAACKFVGAFSGMYDSSTSTPTRTVNFEPPGDVATTITAFIVPGSGANTNGNLFSTLCPLFVGGILLAQDGTCFSILSINNNTALNTALILNNPGGAGWNSGLQNSTKQPFRIYYGGSGLISDVADPGAFTGVNALAPTGCVTTTGLIFGQTVLAPTAVLTNNLDTYAGLTSQVLNIGPTNAVVINIGQNTISTTNLLGTVNIGTGPLTLTPSVVNFLAPSGLFYNTTQQAGSGVSTQQPVIFNASQELVGMTYNGSTGEVTIANDGNGFAWATFIVSVQVTNVSAANYIAIFLVDRTNSQQYSLDQRQPVNSGAAGSVLNATIRVPLIDTNQVFRIEFQQAGITTTPQFAGGGASGINGQFTRMTVMNW